MEYTSFYRVQYGNAAIHLCALPQYSNSMPVTTIRVSDEMNDEVEGQLDYNDTKSDWFRRAAEEKLDRDRQTSDSGSPQADA